MGNALLLSEFIGLPLEVLSVLTLPFAAAAAAADDDEMGDVPVCRAPPPACNVPLPCAAPCAALLLLLLVALWRLLEEDCPFLKNPRIVQEDLLWSCLSDDPCPCSAKKSLMACRMDTQETSVVTSPIGTAGALFWLFPAAHCFYGTSVRRK